MPTPTKLGIIGFGIMGERLLRAALEHAAESVTPVAVRDPSPATAARVSSIPGAPAMLASAEAVIAACECLYIAAPPAAQLQRQAPEQQSLPGLASCAQALGGAPWAKALPGSPK